MGIKPISPDDVVIELPDYVIQGTNELIKLKAKYERDDLTFKQNELIDSILKYAPEGTTRDFLFENKFLDIENLYMSFGWKVEFEKPLRDESFDAYFKFTKKKK